MKNPVKSVARAWLTKKVHRIAVGTATAMMFGSTLAGAVTFDFVSLANGNEKGYTTFTDTEGGITLEATGQSADGKQDYYAYMDSGYAGLGVCKVLTTGDQCGPSSDDNVTFDERLRLSFSQPVSLSDVTFINGYHGSAFDGIFQLGVDGAPMMSFDLAHHFSTDLTGTTFDFVNPNIQGDSYVSNGYQFYIGSLNVTASPVPVPAAGWLFVSGILGLIGLSRHRKAAPVALRRQAR